jgi:hypothetical protein
MPPKQKLSPRSTPCDWKDYPYDSLQPSRTTTVLSEREVDGSMLQQSEPYWPTWFMDKADVWIMVPPQPARVIKAAHVIVFVDNDYPSEGALKILTQAYRHSSALGAQD